MNLQQPIDAFLLVNVYINGPFIKRESIITGKESSLMYFWYNRITWPYLECGAGIFNKETSSNILLFCFYGIEALTHLSYDKFIIKIALVYAMVLSP